MNHKEIEFQKELKDLITRYGAQYEWDYGFYEGDQDYQHITLKAEKGQPMLFWSISDLFPERAMKGSKYI